jgi:hypothetical protein
VTARLEDLQREAKALTSKADSMQRAHKAELVRQQHQKEALLQQLHQEQQAHLTRATELEKEIEALRSAAAEQRADNTAESSKVQAAQQTHVVALEERLAEASGECSLTSWPIQIRLPLQCICTSLLLHALMIPLLDIFVSFLV